MLPYSLSRDMAIMGIVVALNTSLELTLGTFLHAVNFPLTGSLMVVINVMAYALAYSYYPRFGRITLMGLACAVVQFLIAGGLKYVIVVNLAIEAFVIDIAISVLGLNRRGFLITGAIASLTTLGMKFMNMQVFRGIPLDLAIKKLSDFGGNLISPQGIIITMVVYRLVIGLIFASIFWGIFQYLHRFMPHALMVNKNVKEKEVKAS